MYLSAADGPECPGCGCRDSEVLREALPPMQSGSYQWPQPGTAKCGHCRRVFPIQYQPAQRQELRPVRYFAGPDCPECGSQQTRVHTTRKQAGRRVRYHACEQCQARFKTSEEAEEPEAARIA